MDRSIMLADLDLTQLSGVEIGPLHRPFVNRTDGNIIYVDYTNRSALVEKYRNDPNVNVADIVEVDVIWGQNTLADAMLKKRVDYIVASHVIEHVPDLVTWLAELRSVLKDTGAVRLAVPDRRFSFDILRKETRLSDVLTSYLSRARTPQTHEILDHHLNVTTVDCAKAWDDSLDLETLKPHKNVAEALDIAKHARDTGAYYDSHCWVFTPKSFAKLFLSLAEADLIDFACERFVDTQKYTLEFFVGLRPSTDKNEIMESWRRVHANAQDQLLDAHGCSDEPMTARHIIDTQRQSLKEQELTLHRISEELKDARRQLTVAQEAIRSGEFAQIRVAQLEQSSSWRITAPLRSVATLARRWSR